IPQVPETFAYFLDDSATNASFASYHLNFPDWKHRETDVNTASCVFHALGKLVDAQYRENHPVVRDPFKRMEQQTLEMQPLIEEKALKLYQEDRQKALDYLTDYTRYQAINAHEKAQSLTIRLMNQ
ncbi:MAG: hypothetical protein K9J27_12960, partial [Bacteroidales bacterium]|nr:hypothetical protein [Bacteroidales bacterium]